MVVEHGCGGLLAEPLQPQLGQAGLPERGRRRVTQRGEQRDRLGLQAPRHEGQDVGGGGVEPVRVLDGEQHRGVGGGVADQLQRGERDAEEVWRRGAAHPEGGLHRFAVRGGQRVEVVEDRQQQLVQARERQVRLGLHAGGAEHPHAAAGRAARRLPEQRRLPDPRLAADEQRAAPLPHPVEQARDRVQLAVAAEDQRGSEHRATISNAITRTG